MNSNLLPKESQEEPSHADAWEGRLTLEIPFLFQNGDYFSSLLSAAASLAAVLSAALS